MSAVRGSFRLPGIGSRQRGLFHNMSAHACFNLFVESARLEVDLRVKCEQPNDVAVSSRRRTRSHVSNSAAVVLALHPEPSNFPLPGRVLLDSACAPINVVYYPMRKALRLRGHQGRKGSRQTNWSPGARLPKIEPARCFRHHMCTGQELSPLPDRLNFSVPSRYPPFEPLFGQTLGGGATARHFHAADEMPVNASGLEVRCQNGRYNNVNSPRAINSEVAMYQGQGPRTSSRERFWGLVRRYM